MAPKPICSTGKGLSLVGYKAHRFSCSYYLQLMGFPPFSRSSQGGCRRPGEDADNLSPSAQIPGGFAWLQAGPCLLWVSLMKPSKLEVAEGPCPHVHLEHMVPSSLTTRRQEIGQAVCQQSPCFPH